MHRNLLFRMQKLGTVKNLKYAIIGAYEKNFGSNKTIEKNGGVLYKKEIEPKELSDKWKFDVTCNFYRIDL